MLLPRYLILIQAFHQQNQVSDRYSSLDFLSLWVLGSTWLPHGPSFCANFKKTISPHTIGPGCCLAPLYLYQLDETSHQSDGLEVKTQRIQTAIEASKYHGKAHNPDSCVKCVHSCAYKCSGERLVERNLTAEGPSAWCEQHSIEALGKLPGKRCWPDLWAVGSYSPQLTQLNQPQALWFNSNLQTVVAIWACINTLTSHYTTS